MTTAVKIREGLRTKKMSNIDDIKNYTVIDLEMTGLSAKNDKIIEIGAARVRGGEIVDTISTLVNPKQHIPYITRKTKYIGLSLIKLLKNVILLIVYRVFRKLHSIPVLPCTGAQ